jgi:Domain of unknown function (DUF4157)/Papain fold toxin 1, glutamine deamidase
MSSSPDRRLQRVREPPSRVDRSDRPSETGTGWQPAATDTASQATAAAPAWTVGSIPHDFGQLAVLPKSDSNPGSLLRLSVPDTPPEREADRVAERVMAIPEPGAVANRASLRGRRAICDPQPPSSGSVSHSHAGSRPAVVDDVLRSPGQSLDGDTRTFMESRFGHDFADVRLHSGSLAAHAAAAVQAKAFTVGKDVVLGQSSVSGNPESRRLLAHELAHVVQQRGRQPSVDTPVVWRQPVEGAANTATPRIMVAGRTYTGTDDELARSTRRMLDALVDRIEAAADGHRDYMGRIHDWAGAVSDWAAGTSLPPIHIWESPRAQARQARSAVEARDWPRAGRELTEAISRYEQTRWTWNRYLGSSQSGAQAAIATLQGVQVVGAMAATIASGGIAGAALGTASVAAVAGSAAAVGATAGVYGAAQVQVRQGSERHHGLRERFDWSEVLNRGLHDAVAGFVGAFTGGVLTRGFSRLFGSYLGRATPEALTELGRIFGTGGPLPRDFFMTQGQRFVADFLGGLGSAPLTTATEHILARYTGGARRPFDVSVFMREVIEEAVRGGIIQVFVSAVAHAHGTRRAGAAQASGTAPPPAASQPHTQPGRAPGERTALIPPPPRAAPRETGHRVAASRPTTPVASPSRTNAAHAPAVTERPTQPGTPGALADEHARPTEPDRPSDMARDTPVEDTRPTNPDDEPNRAWLQWVNDAAGPAGRERLENCVRAALATDANLAGIPARALPLEGGVDFAIVYRAFRRMFGAPLRQTAISSVRTQLEQAGPGARGIIVGIADGGGGHAFNAFNDAGTVRFVDGQIGGPARTDGYRWLFFVRTDGGAASGRASPVPTVGGSVAGPGRPPGASGSPPQTQVQAIRRVDDRMLERMRRGEGPPPDWQAGPVRPARRGAATEVHALPRVDEQALERMRRGEGPPPGWQSGSAREVLRSNSPSGTAATDATRSTLPGYPPPPAAPQPPTATPSSRTPMESGTTQPGRWRPTAVGVPPPGNRTTIPGVGASDPAVATPPIANPGGSGSSQPSSGAPIGPGDHPLRGAGPGWGDIQLVQVITELHRRGDRAAIEQILRGRGIDPETYLREWTIEI